MTHEELESQLRATLARRPAPDGFAAKVIRRAGPAQGNAHWARVAAVAAMLAVTVGGGLSWRKHLEEQRRGEETKRQLMLALQIASDKLGVVQNALDRSTH